MAEMYGSYSDEDLNEWERMPQNIRVLTSSAFGAWLLRRDKNIKEQEPKTVQEKQADSEKYQKAFDDGYDNGYAQARYDYEQEPKTGHWIEHKHGFWSFVNEKGERDGWMPDYECSLCGSRAWKQVTKYCPNCGARMVEPQESEG